MQKHVNILVAGAIAAAWWLLTTSALAQITAANDAYQGRVNTPLNVDDPVSGVLANDIPQVPPLAAILVTSTAHGTLDFGLLANGTFQYTPTSGFTGIDSFTYTAGDGVNVSAVATVTITVYPVAGDDSYSASKNTQLTVTAPGVLANDTPTMSLLASLLTNAANGSVTLAADGAFTYTPNAGFTGIDTFTYKAIAGMLETGTVTVTITVASHKIDAENDSYGTGKNAQLTVAAPGVLANDNDELGHSLTAVLGTTTANGTLTLAASGSFTYIPKTGFSGTDSFTYTATDGAEDSAAATVTITVAGHGIDAESDSYSTGKESKLTVAAPGVLANDDGAPGLSLSAVLGTTTANGALTLAANGSFTYIPKTGFTGADSFTYMATDGVEDSAPATVTITVLSHGIYAVADSYSASKNSILSISAANGLLANDIDALGHSLTASLVSTAANGVLVLSGDGSFSYTPNAGFTGSDTFIYRVTDGIEYSTPATVTIAIASHAMAAVDDSCSTTINTALTMAAPGVLANDVAELGYSLSAILVGTTANGVLVLSADGSFSYTPNAGFTGSDTFTYMATDGIDDSEPATVTIAITSHAMAAVDDSYSTARNTPLAMAAPGVLANDSDELGHSLTAILVSTTANGVLVLSGDGSFTYTPSAGFTGIDTFTYKVNDEAEDSAPGTVTIEVQCPLASLLGPDSAQVALLRRYRDGVLAKTAFGRSVIGLYYHATPALDRLLNQDERLRTAATKMLNIAVPHLQGNSRGD